MTGNFALRIARENLYQLLVDEANRLSRAQMTVESDSGPSTLSLEAIWSLIPTASVVCKYRPFLEYFANALEKSAAMAGRASTASVDSRRASTANE